MTDIAPRIDVYRPFDDPTRVIVVACGVRDGKLKTVGVEVTPEDSAYSDDEDVVRAKLVPLALETWHD